MGTQYRIGAVHYDFPNSAVEWTLTQIRQLLEGGKYLTQAEHAELFEHEFARYMGAPYAVSTNSGTGALEIALRLVDVRDREVIVTTNTFAATIFAILRAGGIPVFADVADDMSLDPDEVDRLVTKKTRVVVAVHVGGFVSSRIWDLASRCRKYELELVEDAAHAHGSRMGSIYAGNIGLLAAFSFFPTKVITSAEGGMLVTNDAQLAERARILRDQAKVQNANLHETEGYNWRMSEIHAILGRSQLSLIEDFIAQRTAVAVGYDELLDGTPTLHKYRVAAEARPNYYKHLVFSSVARPQHIGKYMKEHFGVSIGGFVYDVPCHLQPVFSRFSRGKLPNAERLCSSHICLPIYPSLANEPDKVQYVAESLLATLDALNA
jgi:dTDP-4-amino-4,6-dideoxygalactose transaminase